MHDMYRRNNIQELPCVIQSEELCSAMMTVNLQICKVAINGVQVALSTTSLAHWFMQIVRQICVLLPSARLPLDIAVARGNTSQKAGIS